MNIATEKFIEEMKAPIKKGQKFGQTTIRVHDKILATIPLVALEDIDRAGFFKLALHTIMLSFTTPPYWGILLLALIVISLIIRRVALQQRKKNPSGYRSRKRGDDFP